MVKVALVSGGRVGEGIAWLQKSMTRSEGGVRNRSYFVILSQAWARAGSTGPARPLSTTKGVIRIAVVSLPRPPRTFTPHLPGARAESTEIALTVPCGQSVNLVRSQSIENTQ
jgi:hypothetical protein